MMAEPKELINTHRYMYVSNGSGQHLSNDGSSPALDEAQFSYGLRTLPLVCLRTLLLDVAGKMSQLMSQSFIQVCNMIACAVERLSAAMASFHCRPASQANDQPKNVKSHRWPPIGRHYRSLISAQKKSWAVNKNATKGQHNCVSE